MVANQLANSTSRSTVEFKSSKSENDLHGDFNKSYFTLTSIQYIDVCYCKTYI